ncbi:MAG: hypothetical protein PHF63_13080 [Herbinix sp.]|nr:hypothetical protein [Herbinix sp.]
MKREQFIDYFKSLGYILIESDNYNIANRIRKYDKNLFLFFNPKRKRYEIHSCTFFPSNRPTYCVGSPYLDSELILMLKRADNRTEFGLREKMDLLEREELQRENENKKKEQDFRDNFIKTIAKEEIKETRHFYMGR